MSVLNENTIIGASGAGGDYEIEQSLRFDDAYLIQTPSSASNRKTWTWSAWVKRGTLDSFDAFYGARAALDDNNYLYMGFDSDNTFKFTFYSYVGLSTTQLFRDTSAWYHVFVALDTTQATAADRLKLYINGDEITEFSTDNRANITLNGDYAVNTAAPHVLSGRYVNAASSAFDGYLAEVNFIDGLALTPDSFGETGDYGEWKPIAYDGTYGTNGFYLPFEQDYTVEGFSTVTYEGTRQNQYIGGTGFKPDLVWMKTRSATGNSVIIDSVRGGDKALQSSTTSSENQYGSQNDKITAFNNDGFTLGVDAAGYGLNNDGVDTVAWNWDMGGTTASNTSGSITSSVRANTTYGQSIVSYTGTGSAATIGHGLASTPTMIIVKNRSVVNPWWVYTATLGAGKQLRLNDTNAEGSDGGVIWNNTAPTSSVFSVNSNTGSNGSGNSLIAYCFHDVANYSKFSSYEGTGGTHTITTGFAPAFVMIKNADASGNWTMWDNTRNPNNPVTQMLRANTSGAEETKTDREPSFLSTGFSIGDADADTNASGQTYIYAAFADTREYAYWYDQSGNNNDWTSEGGLTESDVMVDSPTNNFATINPLAKDSSVILQEGNLLFYRAANMTRPALSTIGLGSTQKWYCEFHERSGTNIYAGVQWEGTNVNTYPHAAGTYAYVANADGGYYQNGSYTSFNSSMTSGDKIRSIAYDAATGKMWIGANGTFSGNPAAGSGELLTVPSAYRHQMYFVGAKDNASATTAGIANFGQDSSFAGNKTPQGNQDSNGIGDFYYAPPTGFLALCTANLPDVDVIPSEHFNTVLYTGNASTNVISVGFQPDFVWIKDRVGTDNHHLFDAIRGTNQRLISNSTAAENTESNALNSFDTNGFTLGSNTGVNANTENHVAWNWKAGGTAVSNTDGTITSQVSANPSAGFSIVSYTGNGVDGATIGHGLTLTAPELVIFKNRSTAASWAIFGYPNNPAFPNDGSVLLLDNTSAMSNSTSKEVSIGSSTITLVDSGGDIGTNGDNYIAYCFHSVDGYSKVGSFIGNGSETAGPFVYCGFKPKFLLVKRATDVGSWFLFDTERSPYNVMNAKLSAENSGAEESDSSWNIDFLSNGFKLRSPHVYMNSAGNTHIFIAFAENPFKHTNAR